MKNRDIDGWVTLVNNAVSHYSNASSSSLRSINLVEPAMNGEMGGGAVMMKSDAAQQFGQEAFSDYTSTPSGGDRRTSIQNNEYKQISILSGSASPSKKISLVEGQHTGFRNPHGNGNRFRNR